ncbi:MAG: hypothetical protein AB9844_00310 [Clostridiaceae bacterium]
MKKGASYFIEWFILTVILMLITDLSAYMCMLAAFVLILIRLTIWVFIKDKFSKKE